MESVGCGESTGKPEDFLKAAKGKSVSRSAFLQYLDAVIAIAFEKTQLRNTTNSERISWCRVINGAVAAGTPLLRDAELEQLKDDVAELKRAYSERKG